MRAVVQGLRYLEINCQAAGCAEVFCRSVGEGSRFARPSEALRLTSPGETAA